MTGASWFWRLDDLGRPMVYQSEAHGGHRSELDAWRAARLALVARRRVEAARVKHATRALERLAATEKRKASRK